MSVIYKDTIFPSLTRDEIFERVNWSWDFSQCVPLPKATLTCFCGKSEWHGRSWEYFNWNDLGHRIMFRCNVSLKCTWCSHVAIFGVAITEEYYRQNRGNGGNWKQVKERLVTTIS